MKYDRAWPTIVEESKNTDAKVFAKAFKSKTSAAEEHVTVDQILNETFEDTDEEDDILEKTPRAVKKTKKITKQIYNEGKSSEALADIKNVWISLLVIFVFGLYAFNTIFFRLGILETLMSRQTNGST